MTAPTADSPLLGPFRSFWLEYPRSDQRFLPAAPRVFRRVDEHFSILLSLEKDYLDYRSVQFVDFEARLSENPPKRIAAQTL
jgi:hypothetical protein